MAYDDKAHRHEHQVKTRLNDEAFEKLKIAARSVSKQHSVLSREIIERALDYWEVHGELPLEIGKKQA
jgi:predicted DNA-binding protein